VVQVGGDFSKFFVDFLRIGIVFEDTSERSTGIFVATTHEQPTRRFGKDEESSSENGSPDELKSDRDLVASSVVDILGTVDDDSSDQKTDGDHPLVTSDETSSNGFGSALGLVHGNEARSSSNSETSEYTTDDENGNSLSTGLKSNTEAENAKISDDSPSTTKVITERKGEESTDESPGGKNRSYKRVGSRRDSISSIRLNFSEDLQPRRHLLYS